MDPMDQKTALDDELAVKALERIEAMETPGYAFPEPFGRIDRILAGLVIVATTIWIVAGIWM
jgi:hypothetical protein